MSPDAHEPRPFFCPKCGHKHEADLSPMEGHPERHGKVHCSGCGVLLWLSLDEDGQAQAEVYAERHEHPEGEAAEGHKPQVFYCPECNHKHRADLSAMAGHAGVHGKLHCSRCGILLWLSLDADGLPICEAYTEHLEETAKAKAAAAAGATGAGLPAAQAAPARAGSSMPLTIVISAIVAAVVGYLAAGAAGGKTPEAPKASGPNPAMASQIQDLEAGLAAMRRDAQQVGGRIGQLESTLTSGLEALKTDLASQGALLKSMEDLPKSMTEAMGKLSAAHKSLSGRIEANYQRLNVITKKLEAPEGD